MSENVRTYEGMFLVDAGKDFESASAPVQAVLGRCEAEILSIKPWEERRLAYDIRGRKRGLYILTYFKVDPARVTEIEHDCELSEDILRMMVLRGDHLTEEQIAAETPASTSAAAAAAAEAAAEVAAAEAAEAAAAAAPPPPPQEAGEPGSPPPDEVAEPAPAASDVTDTTKEPDKE